MKGVWKSSLGLSLGLLVSGAQAGEVPSPTIIARSGPVVPASEKVALCPPAASLDRPRVQTPSAPTITAPRSSAVSLDRPIPLASPSLPPLDRPAFVDAQVQPATFAPALPPPGQIIARAQGADAPKPLPLGPSLVGDQGGGELDKESDKRLVPVPEVITKPPTPIDGSSGPIIIGSSPNTPLIVDDCGQSDCGGCGDGGGCFCETRCCPSHRFYGSAEYLLWWIKDSQMPALVTTGSVTDAAPGALGQAGTSVLFGGNVNNLPRSGGRFTLGYWFSDEHRLGLEGGFFFLGQRTVRFAADSGGVPVLGRPFFNAAGNFEDVEYVANPLFAQNPLLPATAGRATVSSASQLWGAEINLRTNLACAEWYSVDALGGFRFLSLNERVTITEAFVVTQSQNPDVPVGARLGVVDSFRTQNRFYGEQCGADIEFRRNRWSVNLRGKVALGLTRQTVDIAGATMTAPPGGPTTVFSGGLLALPTNSGRFSRDIFSVVPEVGVNVGYQLTDHWRFFVGYSFLYWSNVLRPGDQIDRVVNPTQLPPGPLMGAPRPAFAFNSTDFWAHGVNFGLEFRY